MKNLCMYCGREAEGYTQSGNGLCRDCEQQIDTFPKTFFRRHRRGNKE